MGLSRPKWTSPGWSSLAFWGCHHRRHAAWVALKPGGPPLPGDGSGDRHMPGGRRPLGPANGGVTEDWGKVILRIKEDLSLRARRPWANGVQLGPDEGYIESIITRRDYGARWGGWLGRHKMNLAYRLVSRTYLKTVWIGGGRLLAVMRHTTNNEHTHTCTVHNCTSAHPHSRQSHCLVEMRMPISTLCALISYIPT